MSPRIAIVASVTALSMAMGGVALADNAVADGDNTTPVAGNPLALGTVCVNSTTDAHALVAISRNGSSTGTNTFHDGAIVTVSVLSISGTGLSASMDSTTITLPSDWQSILSSSNTLSDAVSSQVTYQAGATTGTFSGSVTYRATGTNAGGNTITRDAAMPVSATRSNTGSCAPAPSDTTKPTVTVSFPSPVSGSNGYFNAADVLPVQGTVSAADASNVTTISCSGATLSNVTGYNTNTASGTLTVTGDGTHNISCSATDGASPANTGAAAGSQNTATVKIDATAPSITDGGFDSGTAGTNGWYTSQVTNRFSATDATSGLADCPASFTRNSGGDEGTSVKIASGSCSDNAGNTNNGINSAAYKIDTTGPSAVLTPSGTPGANGWFTSNVTVETTGSDSISGPVTCTDDQTQTTETKGRIFNGSCTNRAGLKTDAAPLTVKVDKTGPTATLTPSGTAGANGWFTSNVTVSTGGTDDISGPTTCTDDQTQTEETAGTVFNGSCTNDAGLKTDAAPLIIKVDKTGPTATLTPSGTAGANGWFTSNVTVSTTGADDISGPTTCTDDQTQIDETAGTVFNGSCTNDAGLSTDADALNVKVDKTGPSAVLSALGTLGNNGWYVSDVTIQTTGTDSISGPATCSGDQSLTTDSAGRVFNGSCTNEAGLSTDGTALTIKRDATKPILNPSVLPMPVVVNGSATASANASDATSGLLSSSCGPVDTSSVGSLKSVSCSATDNAGNTNTGFAVYGVIYSWTGFFQPVENLPTWNVAKAGQSIPVKFSLGGNQGLNVLRANYPAVTPIACPTASAPTDTIETYVTTANNGLVYDTGANQYNFVWKTDKAWAGKCFGFELGLVDGSSHSFKVQFTK